MPSLHDIQAAVPPNGGGAVDKTLLRNAVQVRTAYVLGRAEDPGDLVGVDPVTGAAIICIVFKGRLFDYDPDDGSTPPDGITCLVTNDGRRYKLSDGADVFVYSVLSKALTTPPVSPSPTVGDAYLVAAAATGAWAGKSNFVAVLTERGPDWEFIDFGIGRLIYVEDEDAYYHRNSGGAWVAGFGNLIIGANTVRLSAAINFGKRVIVEDMTTTAPPGTASVGTAFVVGSSATGAWSGQDGKIAICEVANQFTIYNPGNGWLAFNKADGTEYRHNGTGWIAAAGSWVDRKSVSTASGSTTAASGTASYSYSTTTAPTTSQRRTIDTATISFTAKKSGAVLRFDYTADVLFTFISVTFTATTGPLVLALFRDSEADAIAWKFVGGLRELRAVVDASAATVTTVNAAVRDFFEIPASNTSSHTYRIAIMSAGLSNAPIDATTLTRRLFTVQEAA